MVGRIFADYLGGVGIYALAEKLTAEDIPSPSAHDPDRNRHRSGIAWSKGAVRAILLNPRYTGYQVWNKQHKAETLLNVDDVALGYQTRLQWNDKGTWVWSDKIAHPPIVSKATFEQVQQRMASRGPASTRTAVKTRHQYALAGLLFHAQCGRRMQSGWNNQRAHYRCRFPSEYAIANKLDHPVTVYLREDAILGPLDTWLASAFDPARIEHTLAKMKHAQPDTDARADAIRKTIDDCDRKLTRRRAALEAGAAPALVAAWSREVQAQRTAAQAQLASVTSGQVPGRRMTADEIRSLVDALGGLLHILNEADPADKLEVYRRLGLRLTYDHKSQIVVAEAQPPPGMCVVSVSEDRLHPKTHVHGF